MNEMDNENAGIVQDGPDDDNNEIVDNIDNTEVSDKIDTSTMTAELTGHEILRVKLRMFLELFTTEKNELILTLIKTSN